MTPTSSGPSVLPLCTLFPSCHFFFFLPLFLLLLGRIQYILTPPSIPTHKLLTRIKLLVPCILMQVLPLRFGKILIVIFPPILQPSLQINTTLPYNTDMYPHRWYCHTIFHSNKMFFAPEFLPCPMGIGC